MYGHLSALKRMGVDASDVPTGSSMGVERSGGGGRGAAPAASGWGAKTTASGPVGSAIRDAAEQNGLKTTAVGGPRVGGNSNVHGFASRNAAPALHTSASSFQRTKGVVNTMGGAKDVTRAESAPPPALPPRGQGKAQIMGFSTLDQHTAEGKARREAAEKREAAGGNARGMKLVHVAGGGGRLMAGGEGGGGGAVIHRLGDDSRKDRPSARYGGLQPTMGVAPTKEIRASRVVHGGSGSGSSGQAAYTVSKSGCALGGGGSSGNVMAGGGGGGGGAAAEAREKRLAFFAKKEAEDAARKALQAQG